MAIFSIEHLILENFKSYQQATEVPFSSDPGLKFITGVNEKHPRLGANGIGKSSIWDAVVWTLYGVDTQGDRASDVVSDGAKRPSCLLRFKIGENAYEVERKGNPNALTLNGEKAEQAEVDAVIRLSYKQFCQAIIFGQGTDLFFDLSAPERGALLDEVFDFDLWNAAAVTADQHLKDVDREITRLSQLHASVEGALAELPKAEALEKESKAFEDERQSEIDRLIEDVTRLEHQITLRENALSDLRRTRDATQDESALTTEVNRLTEEINDQSGAARLAKARIERRREEMQFLDKHDDCPTCGQHIDEAFCSTRYQELADANKNDRVTIEESIARIETLRETLKHKQQERDGLLGKKAEARSNIQNIERSMQDDKRALERVEADIERVGNRVNPYAKQIDGLKARKKELQDKKAEIVQARDEWEDSRDLYSFWKDNFKKVRLFLLKRTLDVLTLETAAAASALGLVDWRIEFVTETETKSGTRKQGVQILVYQPGSEKPRRIWSGGEAQRVRLAVSLGLASMIERMAGISSNVETWDEPTAGLSQEGIEDLLDCLRYRAETNGRSIWLVDHHSLSYAGFVETWWITKTSNGSQIERLGAES